MSRDLSFVELINLAIGSPELGHVNFNALHLFLQSLVEHLRLQDVRRAVAEEELDFLPPAPAGPPSAGPPAAAPAEPPPEKPRTLFHQMQERIGAIERQLRFLNAPPDTIELLARTQGLGQPALDMWQMMQLKKKLELNEEGMTKAMNTLQDLLSSICGLQKATEGFQEELGQLKEEVAQINGDEMKERLLCLDRQARMMEEMQEQLGLVKERVSRSATASKVVSWSALCETLTGKTCEEEEEEEGRDEDEWGRQKADRGREEEEWGREKEDRRREKAEQSREKADRGREEEEWGRDKEGRRREKVDRGREEEEWGSDKEGRRREKADRGREEEEWGSDKEDRSREKADRRREKVDRSREEEELDREKADRSREKVDRSREEEELDREKADRSREKVDRSREEEELDREKADRGREKEDWEREKEDWERDKDDWGRDKDDRGRDKEDWGRDKEGRGRDKDDRGRDKEGRGRDKDDRGRDKEGRGRDKDDRGRDKDDRGRDKEGRGRDKDDRGRDKEGWGRDKEGRGRDKEGWGRDKDDRGRDKEGWGRDKEDRSREKMDRGRGKQDRGKEKTTREILAVLGQLPEKHEALVKHIAQLEAQLKYPAGPAALEMPPELKTLLERMETLQTQSQQGKESLQETLEQMEKLREQFENLQQGVEMLARTTTEMQIMRNLLHQLEVKKADKDSIQEEMNVKADKSALEAMVNHGQLQLATRQLSEMMQDLLQKMSLQDKDWQKALEKLFVDMDCKLDRLALDPVSRQLEEVWKFIKKYLTEGPRFDADSAAGFKKQLFERVKCISCDRPVTMMTGPHMITVRKATLKPRPVSAGGYEYLFHQQKRDQDLSEMSGNPPLPTCWQCQAQQQACALKHRAQDFATLYPYGDPTAITYDNTEVDILGVNGVLYKGRVSSHAAERTLALQKEFAALKIPRPPTGVRMERVRSAFADVSAVPYPPSALRRVGSAIANGNQRLQQLSCDPVDRRAIGADFNESHVQNERDVPGLGTRNL
ncbi:uncharacterized protein C16orf96 homolog [Erythrolamprus reginae]|uniref:uncharacterized protein C16orf96 homolog n=1 Tax=Erythrolamprus reginae TaxID=121349 RepID=UPI00396C7D32